LPAYAWNHTTRFWHEAPASAAFRHRALPRHDLLGALSEHASSAEPAWRNHLRLSEVPWLEHHKVQGSVLFPFAGMVAMAVEAVRQAEGAVGGVRLRHVRTEAALLVPTEGVETRFVLRAGRGWRGFLLESRNRAGAWTRNCAGLVKGEKEREAKEGFVDEELAEGDGLRGEYERLSGAGLKEGRPEVLFDAFAEAGVDMGPTFSNITAFRSSDTEAICELAIPDTKAWMPAGWESPNLLHPAVLDTIFQTFVAIQDGATLKKPRIPKHVANVYISAHIPSSPGTQLLGFAKRTDQLYTEQIGSMAISTAPWSTPLVIIDGFKVIDLDTPSVPHVNSMLASRPVWAVDITTLTRPQTMSVLQSAWEAAPALDATLDDDLEHVAFIYCKRALAEFTLRDVRSFLPHHKLLYHYIQREYVQALEGTLRAQRSDWLEDDEEADTKLLARVSAETVDGRLLCRVGENLERIFRREVEPLEVMREGNLLTEFYRSADSDERTPAVAREFIRQLSHKKPLRIVEVGAGTGGATSRILAALGTPAEVTARVERYTYTDVSSAFFEAAAKDFGRYGSVMDYKVLDVEKDPEPQGHAVGTYDIVVAFQVLHATSSTSTALAHCRKMLKPGGCLLLFEFTGQRRRGHMVFGTLPGWWAGEKDGRKWGPLLMDEEWDAQLRGQGFGGIEWCFHDRQTEGHFCSIIMSRAQPAPQASLPSQVVLVTSPASSTPSAPAVLSLVSQLTTLLSAQGVSVEQAPLSSLPPLASKTCISLLEADAPFLSTISPTDFDAVKNMISTSATTVWLTRGGTMTSPVPEMALITGFSRTIRSEMPDIGLTTLDLDPSDPSSDASTIAHLLSLPAPEPEYALRNAVLHIPRLLPDAALSAIVDPVPAAESLALEPIGQRPLRLELKTQGVLESFRFVADEGCDAAPLAEREVEIRVKAVGLSLYDLACAMGRIWSPEKGVEFSGVVTRVGSGVTRVRVGERVMSWAPGLYRTFIRNSEDVVTVLPDASIGAEVYATVSSEAKRKILVDEYGVAEDHIFSNKDIDFAKGIKRMTKGRGVDVILNSTVGEVLRQTWHCIAPLGRFIELGIADIESNTGLDMAPFAKNTTFSSVMLSTVVKEKPHMYAQLMDDVLRYYREGVIRLVKPIQIMKFSEIEEAFRIMNMKKHTGKMVLKVVDGDMVPVIEPLQLRPDATYFVPGGLGGLGRSLSLWMANKGARHFLFTSRSGAKDPRAQQALDELSQAGAKHMVFACDISDEAKLKHVLDQVESEGFPPIRGILMLAMQLQDVIFDKMTAADFHTPLISKLHATRNVHNLAPANLDFFITTSSIGGIIGTRSQGAYAAGNTYQDALMHHRRSLNLPATSICLGKVAGIGHVAEHGDRVDFLPTGAPMLSEPQLLATLETAMANALDTVQPVVGLATGGALQRDGDAEPYWFSEPRFGALKVFGTQDEGGEARKVVGEAFVGKLARTLLLKVEDVDVGRPVNSYGVDSLVAVEVRTWVLKEVQSDVSVFEILSNVSLEELVAKITEKS
ncbi:putative polyketide synthase, partial [Lasiosphaeris hirsuta]